MSFNLSEDELRARVIDPWELGEPIVLQGQQFSPHSSRVQILDGPELPGADETSVTRWTDLRTVSNVVTDDFLIRAVGSRAANVVDEAEPQEAIDRRTVMVVHGRDIAAAESMFAFLRALDLKPLEWSQLVALTGEASPYIGDVLRRAFEIAQAAVVMFTPDEDVRLAERLWDDSTPDEDKELHGQARPNVFFEAGLAFGRFPDRTVMVEIGSQTQASDLAGRHALRLDDSPERRNELAQRLQSAGCPIDTEGNHWLSVGTFT